MIIFGITGSVATGKSFVADCFVELGYRVFNADECVHHLLSDQGRASQKVAEHFPDAVHSGKIDRKILGEIVFSNTQHMQALEAILHPMVEEDIHAFLTQCKERKQALCVLDIPLLFEKKLDRLCDYIIVTTVCESLQQKRFLSRNGMTQQRLDQVLASQMPDQKKQELADFVIDTEQEKADIKQHIDDIIERVLV